MIKSVENPKIIYFFLAQRSQHRTQFAHSITQSLALYLVYEDPTIDQTTRHNNSHVKKQTKAVKSPASHFFLSRNDFFGPRTRGAPDSEARKIGSAHNNTCFRPATNHHMVSFGSAPATSCQRQEIRPHVTSSGTHLK